MDFSCTRYCSNSSDIGRFQFFGRMPLGASYLHITPSLSYSRVPCISIVCLLSIPSPQYTTAIMSTQPFVHRKCSRSPSYSRPSTVPQRRTFFRLITLGSNLRGSSPLIGICLSLRYALEDSISVPFFSTAATIERRDASETLQIYNHVTSNAFFLRHQNSSASECDRAIGHPLSVLFNGTSRFVANSRVD